MTHRFLYFPGCKIPDHLPQYGTSTLGVFSVLGIIAEDAEFNCCGYPVRHQDAVASILSAAKNLAIADQKGLDIVTPCKCCFGNLNHAVFRLKKEPDLKRRINGLLSKEGLTWHGRARVHHILQVFRHHVGIDNIVNQVSTSLSHLKVAAHYGCHALRPSDVVNFDNPTAPTIFEDLIRAIGAKPVEWPLRLECCGYPLWEKNSRLSLSLMGKKVLDADASGADLICTACTYCQMMFDNVRFVEKNMNPDLPKLPSVLYTQLLGMALGLDIGLDDFPLK